MNKKMNLKNILFLWLIIFQILCISATKYTYNDLQPCEECEENSKIFYEMENIKCCPRCTLSYLTHNLQKLETIQFYTTDVFFHHFNESTDTEKITWELIRTLVGARLEIELRFCNMQFKVDLKSGKKLKLNLTRFTNDLMFELAVNLNSTDIALIKEKQCKNCGTKNNQLIKTWCCEEFLCLHCISGIQVKNGKCMLCKKYLYRNKTQFQHLVKRLCLIHWKGDRIGMEIRGNKGILENEIKKLIMPSKQIKENMLEKEAVRIIGNIEMELKVEKKRKDL